MLAVRLFGRIPVTATPFKRASCFRLLAGITSGGSALTIAWKHHRVHASTLPQIDINKMQPIVQEVEAKKLLSPSDKFDWNLFWYYLRPQIWIIACATAVGYFSFCLLRIKQIVFLLDSSRSCLFKRCYST
jgi:hypothetical protein